MAMSSLCCNICLTQFGHYDAMRRHKCSITVCPSHEEPDLVVRGPGNFSTLIMQACDRGSISEAMNLSSLSKTAVPGVLPLFFPDRRSPPILGRVGCVSRSYEKLTAAAKRHPVKLMKELRITVEGSVLLFNKSLLPRSPSDLRRRGLRIVDRPNHVLVYHTSLTQVVQVALFSNGETLIVIFLLTLFIVTAQPHPQKNHSTIK